ncbi:hypothetical protein A4D02_10650 [Niastella koreensis]|uniref:Uncharacterized protein n=2 Tax=Niastella koreensis TaxID=354356 RepID=G8T6Y8_NIAKG|nr:hypothetical protein [Niastella koreensis]AEV99009.1 hypothetical protein Niako_2670 [Niastella koreensis GR20-10]OQP43927.1 hypothetical protein A4D02_10650 [Niastella koreensis]
MEAIKKRLHPYFGKDLTVVIDDDNENLIMLDWDALSREYAELTSKMKGMTQEQMGDFLQANSCDLMDIYEYFMDDDCIGKVENEEWLPIGLLGLTHSPDSYAEMSHGGLLLLDLGVDEENPPVIRFYESEEAAIAEDFEALQITVVKG